MDQRSRPLRRRVNARSSVQVAVPLSAYLLLAAEAADAGITKSERLRQLLPAERLAERQEAQALVARLIRDGITITAACRKAGISRATFDAWRLRDEEFGEMLHR